MVHTHTRGTGSRDTSALTSTGDRQMTWYKVFVYGDDGTCLTTERHMSEESAQESCAAWRGEGIRAWYEPED